MVWLRAWVYDGIYDFIYSELIALFVFLEIDYSFKAWVFILFFIFGIRRESWKFAKLPLLGSFVTVILVEIYALSILEIDGDFSML